MKFNVSLAEFQKALEKALPAMPKKSTLPILEHFNFKLSDNVLKIIATDQDLTIMTFLPVDAVEPGEVLVPGKKISEIVRALDSSKILDFSVNSEFDIQINAGSGKFKMKGIDTSEYLVLPQLFESEKPDIELLRHNTGAAVSKNPTAIFKAEEITTLSEKTAFAVSKDEYRPAMTGVYFEFKGDSVNVVATDSYRLVKLVQKVTETAYPNDLNVIIPSRSIELLKKADSDTVISFIKNNSKLTHCRFDIGDTVMITRIIDEKYPPYETVLPKNNSIVAIIPKEEILGAIKRVSIFANNMSNQIRLNFENNVLIINTKDDEAGTNASEEVPCEFDSEPFSIGFNYKYLQEAINNIDDKSGVKTNFRMTFSEPNRPSLLSPIADVEHESLLMLLMPVRI